MTRRLILCLALAWAVRPASAQNPPAAPPQNAPPAQPAAAPADGKTAEQTLAQAKAAWDALADYHCVMRSWNRLGDKTDAKILDFSFKKPQMARSQVVEGENQGGVVTRNAKGILNGRKGGVLSIVVLTLEETDKRIYNIRGKKFYQADFGTMLGEWEANIKGGWKLERAADEKFKGADCGVLAISGALEGSKVTKDMFWIDQKTGFIRRRQQYEGETLVNDASYWDIEPNKGQPDEFFTLK